MVVDCADENKFLITSALNVDAGNRGVAVHRSALSEPEGSLRSEDVSGSRVLPRTMPVLSVHRHDSRVDCDRRRELIAVRRAFQWWCSEDIGISYRWM